MATKLLISLHGFLTIVMATDFESHFKIENIQPTPNPDAIKIVLDRSVAPAGAVSFERDDYQGGDSFADAMFSLRGVESVYLNENFITLTKSMLTDWLDLEAPVRKLVEDRLGSYDNPEHPAGSKKDDAEKSILEDVTPEAFQKCTDSEKAEIIDALFDERIRPALAADGGGLRVALVEGKKVRIHYEGACGSCPSSVSGTLRTIQNILQETLDPEIQVFSM